MPKWVSLSQGALGQPGERARECLGGGAHARAPRPSMRRLPGEAHARNAGRPRASPATIDAPKGPMLWPITACNGDLVNPKTYESAIIERNDRGAQYHNSAWQYSDCATRLGQPRLRREQPCGGRD